MRTQPVAGAVATPYAASSEPAPAVGLFAATLGALLEAPGEEEQREEDAPVKSDEREERAEAVVEPSPLAPTTIAAIPPTFPAGLDPAPAVERVSRGAAPEPPVQEMLREVQVVSLAEGTSLHLELETPRSSRVGLDLRLERGRIEACFVASSAEEQALLRAGVAELEAGLVGRGLAVGALRVALADGKERERQRGRGRQPPAPWPARRRRGREVVV